MKLYYSPGACSLADHIALIAAGIDHVTEKVDLKVKTTETGRDYRQINPKGYVPALELDDGQVLTENIAILLYIAHRSGKLLPDDFAKWRVIEMIAFVSTELHKNFKPLFEPQADDEARAKAKEIIAQRMAYADGQLGGRDYIVGDALTIADCYLFVMLIWCRKHDIKLPPGLIDYCHRIDLLPPVVEAMTKEGLR
jgi:glutathione S-transferase